MARPPAPWTAAAARRTIVMLHCTIAVLMLRDAACPARLWMAAAGVKNW
jgi:hypothetical protein